MYYQGTVGKIKKAILEKYPDAKPSENMADLPGYILWMIERVAKMEKTKSDSLRAARWLGWILRAIEEDLRLWDNLTSRALVRKDVERGYESF